MLSWRLEELELGTENRGIKDYKSMSIDKLLSMLDASESIKESEAIKGIRKESFDANKIPKIKDVKDRALGYTRNLFRSQKGY